MSLLRFMKISADEVDLAVHAYVDQITAVSMPTALIETVQTEGKLVYGAAPIRREATQ